MGMLHGALASATNLAEIVAIVDKNSRVRGAVKRAFGNKVLVGSDVDELRDHSLDAIYVTTPIANHDGAILEAINAGVRGIFVEKTLTDDAKTSEVLAETTAARDIITAVGYQKRFAPTFRYLRKLLHEGTLGTVETVHAYAYSQDFLGYENRDDHSAGKSRGGLLRDLGSHALDMTLWLLGFEDLRLINTRSSGEPPCAEMTLTLSANKASVTLSTSWCKSGYRIPEIGIEVTCSEGKVFASDDEVLIKKGSHESRVYRVELGDNVKYLLASPDYFVENNEFLRSVVSESVFPEAGFKEASIVDRILDQVLCSCSF
jgi:predicted dehydrogenase